MPRRALLLLTLASTLLQPSAGRAQIEPARQRPIIVATAIGARFFPGELELSNDFAFGGKVGLGFGRRWALIVDFIASHPHRQTTDQAEYVDALRVLARANLRTGRFRPYVEGGVGGVLFIFNDTPTTAGGALTAGLGMDYRVAPQTFLYVEGSTDFYSQQEFTYGRDGSVDFVGPSKARKLGTVEAGLGVEF